jgi:heparosan-N-sulfate-glucuronate 5-epimerase
MFLVKILFQNNTMISIIGGNSMSAGVKKGVIIAIVTIVLSIFTFTEQSEGSSSKYSSIVNQAKKTYKAKGYDYTKYIQNYHPQGDYLKFSQKIYQMERIKFDEQGVPMVFYYNKYEYNPVTTAQMALTEYGKYVTTKSEESYRKFIQLADTLVTAQGTDGALRYNFAYEAKHLRTKYSPGWVSAMAQGQALSVYSRAYYLTKDEKYLNAGKAAFKFLMIPKSRGGVLTNLQTLGKQYKPYFFFEEYVTKIDNYTLNGFMFTLLGIYDWSKISTVNDYGQKEAGRMFKEGLKSLLVVLPMYDIGGFTAYDLSHITMKQQPHVVAGYHSIHIYQLHALYTITKEQKLRYYAQKWASYVK